MQVNYLNNHPIDCVCNTCVNHAFNNASKAYYQCIGAISIEDIEYYQTEFGRRWRATPDRPFYKEKTDEQRV